MNLSDVLYNIKDDVSFFLDVERTNIEELSKTLRMSKNTISSIMKNENISDSTYEKIYAFLYSKNYRLNRVKSELYIEKSAKKILFHGAKNKLDIIYSDGARSNCDFGNGFYLGETYYNALSFVSEYSKSCVYVFELDYSNLKVIEYDCSMDWMLLICYFRGMINEYKKCEKITNIIKTIKSADVIVAPIADNRMFHIMNEFALGNITAEAAMHSLSASQLGKQYVFKTDKAISCLKCLERLYLCDEERKDNIEALSKRSAEIETKLNYAKRKFRDGLYIEEILI